MKKQTAGYGILSKAIFTLVVTAGLLGAAVGTAHADEWRDHERHEREWRMHHRHHDHQRIVEVPTVVEAPPVVTDAPSGFNLVFPINIH